MIRNRLSNKQSDPCTPNCFVYCELHSGEEEGDREYVKCFRLCALYIASYKALKATIARVGLRFAPRAVRTAKANLARRGNLVYIERPPEPRAAINQVQPTLRELLLLCDVEKLSYKDIALILDILISTLPTRSSNT